MIVIERPKPKSSPAILEFIRDLLITAAEEEITGITVGIVKGRRGVEVGCALAEKCDSESIIEAAYAARENVLDALDDLEEKQELDFDV